MGSKSYARQKGKQGERELAEWMEKMSGVRYRRVPMSGALHLDLPMDVMKIGKEESIFDDVCNENKKTKQLSVKDWIEQTEVSSQDCSKRYWFIRFVIQGTGKNYFILNQEYFEKLLQEERELIKLQLQNNG